MYIVVLRESIYLLGFRHFCAVSPYFGSLNEINLNFQNKCWSYSCTNIISEHTLKKETHGYSQVLKESLKFRGLKNCLNSLLRLPRCVPEHFSLLKSSSTAQMCCPLLHSRCILPGKHGHIITVFLSAFASRPSMTKDSTREPEADDTRWDYWMQTRDSVEPVPLSVTEAAAIALCIT